jgi:hypothetical protein
MAIASRRVFEYPFHSRLSRLASLALGVVLLWFGSGQLTIAGLLLMFSGLVIAVTAVRPPQPSFIPRNGEGLNASDYQTAAGSQKASGYRQQTTG